MMIMIMVMIFSKQITMHTAPPHSPTSGNQLPTTDAVGKAASEVSSGFSKQTANQIYAFRQSKLQNKQRKKNKKLNKQTN